METVAYSTATGGFVTQVRGDREYVKAELMARALAAGFSRERAEWAIKKYRTV